MTVLHIRKETYNPLDKVPKAQYLIMETPVMTDIYTNVLNEIIVPIILNEQRNLQ